MSSLIIKKYENNLINNKAIDKLKYNNKIELK